MSSPDPHDPEKNTGRSAATRRQFLSGAGATVAAGLVGSMANAAGQSSQPAPSSSAEPGEFDGYSRWHPGFGGPVGSDHYLGKLVPGRRPSGLEPVLCEMTDMTKVPWKMVDGVKVFELRAMAVQEEFLPGMFMNVWGYNGSMPGPMIEAFQGDRVRIIVHNELPEATTVHWHGLELPVQYDGVPGLTQNLIPPGGSYVYEFDLHQTGTFFYHSHIAMQEAFGMVGFFIIHPRVAYDPPVDRDFALIFQNFYIDPNTNIPDAMRMDWNWHTINGRSGPFTTPLVVKHGERVRVRLMDFSPMQHHPIHLHGHTFWLTGTEAGRIPTSAWIPRNVTLVGVAMANDFEFVANNPGDWIFHCHMVHHMMNHMVRQVGPRIRTPETEEALRQLNQPLPSDTAENPGFKTPGYPQKMQGMYMSMEAMQKINGKRETHGMRKDWMTAPKGLMTVLRVLPDELYARVMESDQKVEPGSVFDAIVRGDYAKHNQENQT